MIAVLASICLGAACQWVTVTTSEQEPNLTMMSCQMGQRELSEWLMRERPGYTLGRWKCVMGERRSGI